MATIEGQKPVKFDNSKNYDRRYSKIFHNQNLRENLLGSSGTEVDFFLMETDPS